MNKNVFFRTTLRQPIKTIFLLALTALVTFAFVARGAEWLLIRQETARLGSYYQAVGTLENTHGDPWADTGGAAAYLQSREDVAAVNRFACTSGIIQDGFSNGDIDAESRNFSVAFCGMLQSADYGSFSFLVDTPLLGYEDYLSDGQVVTMAVGLGDSFDREKAGALTVGERYLVLGSYIPGSPGCSISYDPDTGRLGNVGFRLLPFSEDAYFYPLAEGEPDWSAPALADWRDWFDFAWEDQRALHVAALEDMSALPLTADTNQGIYLTAGRWLDGADTAAGSRVCVINQHLASLRGLEIGDTLTLELRDVPSLFGYCRSFTDGQSDYAFLSQARRQTETYEIVGIYDYLSRFNSTAVRNFTYVPASTVPENFAMSGRDLERDTARTLDGSLLEYGDTYTYQLQQMGGEGILPYPGSLSFTLEDPGAGAAFVEEARSDLDALGFRAEMLENNWENF